MTWIDISAYQGHPNFAPVKAAGVTTVILKCGGGEGGRLYTDSAYVANRGAARAQGLAVGSYFFNGPVDPTAAADYQFSIIDWRPGDVVAIDVENNGAQPHWTPAQVHAWCTRILAHGVPADRVLVYMSSSVLGAGWQAVVALGVGLWVAQYGPNDGNPHGAPASAPWPAWSLWQYTSVKTWPGIIGSVDTNQPAPTWASSGATPLQATSNTPAPILKAGKDMLLVRALDKGTITFPGGTIVCAGGEIITIPEGGHPHHVASAQEYSTVATQLVPTYNGHVVRSQDFVTTWPTNPADVTGFSVTAIQSLVNVYCS